MLEGKTERSWHQLITNEYNNSDDITCYSKIGIFFIVGGVKFVVIVELSKTSGRSNAYSNKLCVASYRDIIQRLELFSAQTNRKFIVLEGFYGGAFYYL